MLHAGHMQNHAICSDEQAVNHEINLPEQITDCTADEAIRDDLRCPFNRLPVSAIEKKDDRIKTDSLTKAANSGATGTILESWIKYLLRWINLLIEMSQ